MQALNAQGKYVYALIDVDETVDETDDENSWIFNEEIM